MYVIKVTKNQERQSKMAVYLDSLCEPSGFSPKNTCNNAQAFLCSTVCQMYEITDPVLDFRLDPAARSDPMHPYSHRGAGPGKVVMVYEDPITRQRPEGKAKLLWYQFDALDSSPANKSQFWQVQFPGDGEPSVSRRIYTHIDGKKVL